MEKWVNVNIWVHTTHRLDQVFWSKSFSQKNKNEYHCKIIIASLLLIFGHKHKLGKINQCKVT